MPIAVDEFYPWKLDYAKRTKAIEKPPIFFLMYKSILDKFKVNINKKTEKQIGHILYLSIW